MDIGVLEGVTVDVSIADKLTLLMLLFVVEEELRRAVHIVADGAALLSPAA